MELLDSLIAVLTPLNLLAIVAGTLAGIIIGGLPGLTANLGVALLLPITFSMDATSALLLLMSLYTAAIYGGCFPAILLYTPGTSASAATAIDGFELTKQGRFDVAIRVATFASVCGGIASGFALLLLAPPLSLLSLKFGPAEYFMLAVFGLTIIGSLSSGNMVKGLISGALGLWLSTVGMDIDSGFPRFTFGVMELTSGIGFVPAVIGLFSISQALLMCEQSAMSIQTANARSEKWRFLPTLAEVKKTWVAILRSSGIGVGVGILPGAGADIGSWVSYNEARRFSKDREKFGKGAVEGIAASEAANNAVTGSSLVPLLTLGIPGSTTAAILLGALIIHGLVPGRTLFTEHAHITYTVIVGFMLANLVMGVVGMGVARYMGRLAALPNNVLIPLILILSLVGAFSLGNNPFDIVVMLAFGLVGYGIRKLGFSPAPLILGLILGPIAEKGFRQSMVLANEPLALYILKSPISLTLAALSVLSIISAIVMEYRSARSQSAKDAQQSGSKPGHG